MNTSISGAAAAISAFSFNWALSHFREKSIGSLTNGILAGLVSITAGCAGVTQWGALIIGFLGGIIYILASKLLIKLRIDDPLDAAPVHGFCGAWGVLV